MAANKQFFEKKSVLILSALVCTALWGSAFPCVKAGYQLWHIASGDAASQMIFAGWRFILAGLMALLAAHFMERNGIPKGTGWRSLPRILLLGVVQTALQYVFYYISMAHVTGVKGAILNGSSAFVCVLMARIYYKEQERLSGSRISGCILGLAGVVIVNLGKGSLGTGWSVLGEGFMILSVLMSALGSLISKEIARDIRPVTLCGGQLLSGGILLTAAGYITGGHMNGSSIAFRGLLLLFYMAFISAAAFSLWTVLLACHNMGEVTVFNFMIPVFGTLLSAIFLGDNLWNPYILSSLPLVCAGIWLVNREPGKTIFNKKSPNLT
ncbi:MAG: DMT family transporter [Eubacterium sp.]|nr:DMT family transporter [Eubacterium sp.]